MNDSVKTAIKTGYFVPCILEKDTPLSHIEAAAVEGGLKAEYDRDYALALDLLETRALLDDAGDRFCTRIVSDHYGNVRQSKKIGNKGDTIEVQICSPIIIAGVGYNSDHQNPVLFMKVHTESGKWVELKLARSELVANGTFAAKVKAAGIRTADIKLLCDILSVVEPKTVVKTYESAGWHGDDFVLPNGDILATNDAVSRVPAFDLDPRWGTAGDEALAEKMLASVSDDHFIVTMIGTVLGAPMIKFFPDIAEPGICHYIGASTTGKTTALAVAMSLQGKGCPQKTSASTDAGDGIILSWNTTAHALHERIAMLRDLAVGLDEFSMISSPKDAQLLSYSTSNGATKAAGAGYNGFRKSKMLRSPIISTGEEGFAEKIGRDGNLKHNAGAAVRTLDTNFVPYVCNTAEEAAARADRLKKCATENYGWHLRKFVRLLVTDREACLKRIEELRQGALREETNAQVNRVRARMSIFAAAIELAIEKGVLPWPVGTGSYAVQKVLDTWKADFANSDLSYEITTALKNFADTMARHRDRIAYLNVNNVTPRDCLAKWKEGKLYFTESQLLEALGGAPHKPFLKHLASGECPDWGLERGEEDRLNMKPPKEIGTVGRVYCIVDKHRALTERATSEPVYEPNADNVVPMTRRSR